MKIQTVSELLVSLDASHAAVVRAMHECPSRVSEHFHLLVQENRRLVEAIAVIHQEVAMSDDSFLSGQSPS